MKKSILIIALALISAVSFSQSKDKAPLKPAADTAKTAVTPPREFQPDQNKVFTITLQLTRQEVAIVSVPERDIENSEELRGKQIQAIKRNLEDIRKVIIQQANSQDYADYTKFVADTTKKAPPVKKGKVK